MLLITVEGANNFIDACKDSTGVGLFFSTKCKIKVTVHNIIEYIKLKQIITDGQFLWRI